VNTVLTALDALLGAILGAFLLLNVVAFVLDKVLGRGYELVYE
jgi:hypothetical protein